MTDMPCSGGLNECLDITIDPVGLGIYWIHFVIEQLRSSTAILSMVVI